MIDPEGLDVIVVGPCWTLTIPVLTCLDHPALKRKPGAVVDPDLLKFQQKQKKSGWDPRQLVCHICHDSLVVSAPWYFFS